MLLENIPLGKTVEIYVEREDYRYRFVSKVEDRNAQRICVTAIASNGRYFHFGEEDKVSIVYRDPECMWEWSDVKGGLAKLDEDIVHYFQITNKGKTFNRRNAYRVSLLEEAEFGYYSMPDSNKKFATIPLPPHEEELSEKEKADWFEKVSEPTFVKGMIKDVSENGVGIYTDAKFQEEDGIFFSITSTYGNLEMKASVVRKIKLSVVNDRYDYYYGCVLTRSDRRLLRYIFDLQREMLKKQRMQKESDT